MSRIRIACCILGLIASGVLPQLDAEPSARLGKGSSVDANDYDSLKHAAQKASLALRVLQPLKASLVRKLERLHSQAEGSGAETNQYLIETQQARLEKIVVQERQLKKALEAIEARMRELEKDPESGEMITVGNQVEEAEAKLKALQDKLPKIPVQDGK